jgi:two-component system, cell cycle response regulator
MYDIIRIIDPVNKDNIIIKDNEIKKINGTCYDFCNRGVSCSNCISMKAYIIKDTCMKIEYYKNKVIFITATPIFIEGKMYVIEMLKDISENGKIFDINNGINVSITDENFITEEQGSIFNRKYIDKRLPIDVNNSIIHGSPLSLIVAHIDNFKDMNDKYGDVIGNKIIKDFVKLISNSIRKNSDWIGMYDVDEILIVLNNTNKGNAFIVSEKIRDLLIETPFKYNDINIKITPKFGVYSVKDNKINIEDILTQIDIDLYEINRKILNRTLINDYIEMDDNELLVLKSKIEKLKDVLDEMCLSTYEIFEDKQKIKISQY